MSSIASTFGVDWPHLTAQLISFAIVCAALYWFAYRPVLRMLESRRQQIAQGLANTEKINAVLAYIEAQCEECPLKDLLKTGRCTRVERHCSKLLLRTSPSGE